MSHERFDIFPPAVEVLPNDVHLFTARALFPPPMWLIIENASQKAVLLPDHSVRRSGVFNYTPVAEGAFHLVSGIGTVELTLDLQCLPLSGVEFQIVTILQRPGGTDWVYRIDVQNTNIEVRGESGLLETLAITPVVGMRIKIEMASGFRLFIDDVLRHERLNLSASVAYPGIYRASIQGSAPATQATPSRIPPVILSGDWQLQPLANAGDPIVTFSVEHGSLSAGANALQKIYSGGSVPGQYRLTAKINPGIFIWMEDAAPTGSTVTSSGGSWTFVSSNPTPQSGSLALKSPNAAGDHFYSALGATDTLPIDVDDVLTCYVFLDSTNTPTEIMLEWSVTDATALEHRAYWGANSISLGTDGTPSRRFMGSLPATNQWVRLEVPASLVDLEGRVVSGMKFRLFDGVCSFDQVGKFPGHLQTAEAIITIPPLRILGETVRTLQPGQKVRFQTNYDIAQTSLITWSVVSGSGSFSQGEFTAGASPGTTVVRATASVGNQVADITINVPAVITPGFAFAGPSEEIDWDTNIGSPTWTASAGSINSSTGVWTAPSGVGQTVKITATDGTFTATRDVLIIEKFPFSDLALSINRDRNLSALVSMSEDRTSRITREKAPAYDSYEVKLVARTLDDVEAVDAFFDAQGFGKPFILEDLNRGVRKVGWFDSAIRHESRDECDNDLSFRFLEARLVG